MKTPRDPRHLKRISVMKNLFTWDYDHQTPSNLMACQIIKKLTPVDQAIKDAAPEWPIQKINKIDLSILRLAIYELIILKDTPIKVVVDEAVEMGKEYGSESSPGFINGVLGKVISSYNLEKKGS